MCLSTSNLVVVDSGLFLLAVGSARWLSLAFGNCECSELSANFVNITIFSTACISGEVSVLHF